MPHTHLIESLLRFWDARTVTPILRLSGVQTGSATPFPRQWRFQRFCLGGSVGLKAAGRGGSLGLVLKLHLQSEPIALTYEHHTSQHAQHGPSSCLWSLKKLWQTPVSTCKCSTFIITYMITPVLILFYSYFELAWRRLVAIGEPEDSVSHAGPREHPKPKHWWPTQVCFFPKWTRSKSGVLFPNTPAP